MTKIFTLGCGGGRHQTLDQTFRTGGFRIHDTFKLHIDPGPGALLLTNQYNLDAKDLDAVFVSHSHPDHYADAEVLVEAMHRGESNAGRFIGSLSAVEGDGDLGPVISGYHKKKAGEIISLEPFDEFESDGLKIVATPTEHSDSTTLGAKIHTSSGIIGYTGDTQYFDELPEIFKNSRVLIANVTRPSNKRIEGHLCSDDLIKILKKVKPDLSIMLHMGMLFLQNSPREQASYVQEESGIRTIPGYAGTEVRINENIQIKRKQKQTKMGRFS